MKKSSDALRTISEVATELDIPKHVLRFWEGKFTQIRPMKRGGGRRYYRPADIELLKGIRRLLYGEGFTIRGVQQIFKRDGIDYVKSFASENELAMAETGAATHQQALQPETKILAEESKRPAFTNVDPKHVVLLSILEEIDACRQILKQPA